MKSTSRGIFYVENLGCAKNQVDAEIMVNALEDEGWTYAASADEADVIIVNTCSFILPARQESVSVFMDFRTRYPGKRIVIAGCFSERYGGSLAKSIPEADGIFGNARPELIPRLLERLGGDEPSVLIPEIEDAEPSVSRSRLLSPKGSAYVKVAEGCDNRCSYCAIPLIRGPLRSRTVDSVVEEIRSLIGRGVFEIVLIAQDLGSFGMDRGACELPELLARLSVLEGRFWIRMLYIHPDRFTSEILDACAADGRILPYFDIPFQHASGKVLRLMNRSGNAEAYLGLIEEIRSTLPAAFIRSTFLVGHPGEGKREFSELLGFVETARIDWAGFFTYSPEEGTASPRMRGRICDLFAAKAARKRRELLESLQLGITAERLERVVGSDVTVLIEERITGEPLALGRAYFTAPDVDGMVVVHAPDSEPGDVVSCRIIKRNGVDVEAVLDGGE